MTDDRRGDPERAAQVWRASNSVACVAVGLAGTVALIALFPGGVLSRITHGVLHLPGPGSGICALYGPLIVLCAFLAARWVRKPGAALLCCAVLGLLHSVFMPILFPSAKTAGTVGPLPLRILGVLLVGAFVECLTRLLARRSRWLRYLVSAACANLALLLFYWAAVYPLAGKRPVSAGGAAVLIGVALVAGAFLGGFVPALLSRERPRRANA